MGRDSQRMRWVLAGAILQAAVFLAACGGDNNNGVPVGPVDVFASVDPFIGTGGLGFGVGSTYPGPALPFAMIHPGPDTRLPAGAPGFSHCAGYWYGDNLIEAFSLMRMNGTGVPDYGVFGFMPVDGMSAERTTEIGHSALFSDDNEEAAPGYYRVQLGSGIEVEITSTARAAIFRVTFPDGSDPVVLLDLEHTLGTGVSTGGTIELGSDGSIDAVMHNNGDLSVRYGGFDIFARAEFDVAPAEVGTWNEAGLSPGAGSNDGVDLGGWVRFPAGTRTVQMRVAVSFVDAAGASNNLQQELASHAPGFDSVRVAAEAVWRDELSVLELEGARERDGVLLATALYHAKLMPSLMSDVDMRGRDSSGAIVTFAGPRYSDFSLWDTYRTLPPWLLFSEDARNGAFAESLFGFASEGGSYPRWSLAHGDIHSMVGTPTDMVMAESAAKGGGLADEEAAYQLSRATAYAPAVGDLGGRAAVMENIEFGFVPDDMFGGSVAKTLEYATADHALSEWARRLGHDRDADELALRAANWRNIFHAESGFIRPKKQDGSWAAWSGPLEENRAYTEGDAWQYLWMVPHDLNGLAEALGGRETALAKLRELFTASEAETPALGLRRYYWQGNEPDIIAPWIFAAWGSPAESVRWIDWVFRENYGLGADGLPGNDDGGTMSSWLLFGAAGIYPIAGTERYIVAAPRQSLMVIRRASGDLRIVADPSRVENPVPLSVRLDGVLVDGPELTHGQLAGDHVLEFTMGPAAH